LEGVVLGYQILILAVILGVTTVSAWIAAFRMRRRIKGALGRNAKGAELTSLRAWMDVNEAEKRKPLGK
jgi:hypothetical protein